MAKTTKQKRKANELPVDSIVLGDCIKSIRAMPADSIDLIFADPPYNIGYQYDRYDDNRADEDYLAWTYDWIDACARLLKPTGSFYVLIGDEYAAETRVHLKRLQRDGQLVFRNWIIWHYTFGQNCKLKFNRSHAHLFYCVGSAACDLKNVDKITKDAPWTFNREAIAVASARQTVYGDRRANPKGKLPDDTWYLRPQAAMDAGERLFDPDCDTWNVSRLCGTFKERMAWHPCQLPEAMLERIINVSSNEGDLVFDPFAGSGTTLAVAARLNRHWLGCEKSPDYRKKALERVKYCAETGQPLLSDLSDKGIKRGEPKKKSEPKRSTREQVTRAPQS